MIAPRRRAVEIADNRVRISAHFPSKLGAIHGQLRRDLRRQTNVACFALDEKAAELEP